MLDDRLAGLRLYGEPWYCTKQSLLRSTVKVPCKPGSTTSSSPRSSTGQSIGKWASAVASTASPVVVQISTVLL